ncbi:phage tail sheath family protein [Aquimarina pacifica]|uniref:phage tail sheath family protein n=1 Tax=Aquimarina pacifica TaxID=1296415 RepID=UPI0004B5E36B|nr:phage tail sheath C-terminal domain-containing protein [Aquimarina pacifica]
MAPYSTPGVYVEEIAKFPPSVAQVATAIPAFIGYTEKATNKEEGDLNEIPTRISSMLEYENYFGGAELETGIVVNVVDDVISVPTPATRSPFLMYYSMQLYFANGGGPCYIVSVDQYGDGSISTVALGTTTTVGLRKGLEIIKKEDEPTLIVFPDATSLPDSGSMYGLYEQALIQCEDLQDRFTIIDTYSYDNTAIVDPNIGELRAGMTLGKDFIKYGAAYYPFVETILDYQYADSQVTVNESSTDTTNLQESVQDISDAIDTTDLETLITELGVIDTDITAAGNDADAIAMIPDLKAKINEIISYINGVSSGINSAIDIARTDGSVDAEANALDTWLTDVLEQTILDLNKSIDRLNADDSQLKIVNEISVNQPGLFDALGIHSTDAAGDALKARIDTLLASGELFALIAALPASGGSSPTSGTLDSLEVSDNALYNRIKAEISILPVILPPSSGMAGVYARVDNSRGVWKAPANVGMTYVSKPTVHISHAEQGELNVHTSGKSINAIRTFVGKGTLIWGARTLAGNDNEWRYVSVRRFFNMAEESIKKATEQFVFEPNDANTWVKVKAMITNFLNLQWRAGALAGPTPDKAFYVNVGLGETMTAQDILEGYMFVEIGMAVVRPAEFIILKFSHKMQEA